MICQEKKAVNREKLKSTQIIFLFQRKNTWAGPAGPKC